MPAAEKIYINLSYDIPEEQFEIASALSSDLPILGLTEGFDVLTWCVAAADEQQVRELLDARFAAAELQFSFSGRQEIVEQNWNKEWEDSIDPVWIEEDVVVCPPWRLHEVQAPHVFIIAPQMSFGTGHHQTTRMVIRLLRRFVQPQSRWVDAGTGTGICAIAARRFGASAVWAFDNDEWSVDNAKDNLVANGAADITLSQEDVLAYEFPTCDGIVANLHRSLLIPTFPRFAQALPPGGTLIISGILTLDEDDILKAAEPHGLSPVECMRDGDWSAVAFTRK